VDGHVDPDRPDVELLARQIADLQQRVRSLEQYVGLTPREREAETAAGAKHSAEAAASLLEETVSVVPLIGKALLGIAGAYLLRALTELGVFRMAVGVPIGMVYALGWLVLAARAPAERRVTAAAHTGTSVLILMPLVWEATVRFQAISCWTAATILLLFSVFGLAISWRKNLSLIASLTVIAGVTADMALLLATHNLAPFTVSLVATAAAVELSACLRHALGLRWFVAFAADLAVLLLTYILTRAEGLPEGYAAIPVGVALAAQGGLLVIYLSSTTVRTLFEGLRVTTFETTQWLLAFLLSLGGALRVARLDAAAVSAVSIFGLACGAACYIISFQFLGRAGKHDRNFYTYTTFGLLLVIGGSRLLVSGIALAVVLSILALVCLRTGRESGRMTLKWHGTLYLVAAAVLSGLTAWSAARLLRAGADWVSPDPEAWISAAAAMFGYAMAWRSPRTGSWPWPRKLVVLLLAANCAWVVAGLATGTLIALYSALGAAARAAVFQPTLRTAVLLALSLTMAWSGTRWQRFEAVWLVYPFLVLTGYKLAVQDLPRGQTLPLFASLFLFGGALVLLPRLMQKPKNAEPAKG